MYAEHYPFGDEMKNWKNILLFLCLQFAVIGLSILVGWNYGLPEDRQFFKTLVYWLKAKEPNVSFSGGVGTESPDRRWSVDIMTGENGATKQRYLVVSLWDLRHDPSSKLWIKDLLPPYMKLFLPQNVTLAGREDKGPLINWSDDSTTFTLTYVTRDREQRGLVYHVDTSTFSVIKTNWMESFTEPSVRGDGKPAPQP